MSREEPSTDRTENTVSAKWRPVNRRGALRALGSLAAALATVRLGLSQRRLALGLDKVEKLKTPGGAALLKIQGRELLFIRDSEESIRVLDPTCTHKKCTVEYSRERQRIVCPCHGSNFSLDGSVLHGPAEKPLQVYDAVLDSTNNRVVFSME